MSGSIYLRSDTIGQASSVRLHVLYLHILFGQGRIQPGIEQDVGNKITFVRAVTMILMNRFQDRSGPFGTNDFLHVVIIIPDITETRGQNLTGVNLPGLG